MSSLDLGAPSTVDGEAACPNTSWTTSRTIELPQRLFRPPEVLENDEEIIDATLNDLLLIGRTEIWDDDQGMSAMVEYPVKTMNIHPERKRFQVDTGPLLFPDLSLTVERQIECFSIAFVCYNTFDLAEFILRVPISVDDVSGVSSGARLRRRSASAGEKHNLAAE